MPIEVKSAHTPRDKPASHVTYCKLDIDIHRNRPRVIEHTRTKNHENLVGTTIELFSAGNWASYKVRSPCPHHIATTTTLQSLY